MISGHIKTLLVSAAIAAVLASAPASAEIAGVLDCDVTGAVAIMIGAKRDVTCSYKLANGVSETYSGTLTDAGLELGVFKAGKIVYNVYGLLRPAATDLEGSFVGGGIGGSVGLDKGVRADNLIGGPANAIVLQPASETSAQTNGINLSAGLRALILTRAIRQ